MELDPTHIYERLVKLGESWAFTNATAELLEENKKPLIAQLMLKCPEESAAKKEMNALAQPEYWEHIEKMIDARRKANIAKVNYDAAKTWAELKRTEAANERAANKYAT